MGLMQEGFIRLLANCILSLIYMTIVGYNLTLTKFEKEHIKGMAEKIFERIRLRKTNK